MPLGTLADLTVLQFTLPGLGSDLVVANADPAAARRVEQALRAHEGTLRRALVRRTERGLRSLWLRGVTANGLRAALGEADPALLALLHEIRANSVIVAPLEGRDARLGFMGFVRHPGREGFGAAEFAAAVVFARRAGLSIHAAALQEQSGEAVATRDRAERAAERWAQVFERAGWGAAIIDAAAGRIELVNLAFARMHGFASPSEVAGRPFGSVFRVETDAGDEVGATLPAGGAVTYETRHRRADTGAAFPVLVDLTALEGGGPPAYVAYVQDLSGFRRAEDRLREAQRMEAVGRLAGGVAHEINNMMTIVLGFAEDLSADPALPGGRRNDVAEILRAARRAAAISGQLLAYSRRQVMQPQLVNVCDAVRSTAQLLRQTLPSDVHLALDLPTDPVSARVDPVQLDQVLINLAFNARDAMLEGGRLTIRVARRQLDEAFGWRKLGTAVAPGPYAAVEVSDTGVGIASEVQARIFEPFFTTKPAGRGTGLGLSTVYGIVKQSGGYVWVDSQEGEGSTFTVCFPESPPEVKRDQFGPDRRRRPSEYRTGTVLLLEDEPALRRLAARVLRGAGHRVHEAATGGEALALLRDANVPVDTLLTDVVVADGSGRALLREVHTDRPDLPVVLMSGHPRQDLEERGLLEPGTRFLQKPFTPESLVRIVAAALDSR
ncbi:MAG TPA: ATP-binding protein [Gemmatimonadales bacterium]|nr:ATP-binding protein [Gemmatimonadales bacterium]